MSRREAESNGRFSQSPGGVRPRSGRVRMYACSVYVLLPWCLELGNGHFDRVQVRAVWRPAAQPIKPEGNRTGPDRTKLLLDMSPTGQSYSGTTISERKLDPDCTWSAENRRPGMGDQPAFMARKFRDPTVVMQSYDHPVEMATPNGTVHRTRQLRRCPQAACSGSNNYVVSQSFAGSFPVQVHFW